MNKRYHIKEAFALQSAGGKLLLVGQYYATEDEKQQEELAKFVAAGSCVENLSVPAAGGVKQPEKEPEKEQEDITIVPGVGKAAAEKLAEAGITTVEGLKEAAAKREEELRELLGDKTFDKVSSFFA